MKYDHKQIESKWQKHWLNHKTFKTSNDFSKPKFSCSGFRRGVAGATHRHQADVIIEFARRGEALDSFEDRVEHLFGGKSKMFADRFAQALLAKFFHSCGSLSWS